LYARLLACFEAAEGAISFRWDTQRVNMAITRRSRARFMSWFGFAPYVTLHVHFMAPVPPADRDLINRIVQVATRAQTNLRSGDRAVLLDELCSLLSNVIAGLNVRPALPDWNRDQIDEGLRRVEREYIERETRGINLSYFLAMLMGLLPASLVALLTGWLVAQADIERYSFSTFVATFVSGSIGAVVSVMVRMSHNRFQQAPELGRGWIRILAGVRPFLGGVFGVLSYFALESHLMGVTINEEGGTRFFAYCVIAFLAGFSERVAQDMLVASARGVGSSGLGEGVQPRIGVRPPDEQLTIDRELPAERS
jgi:hypothetical protein